MKIAFVTTYDAQDVSQWSGIPAHMADFFRINGATLNFIGPLTGPPRFVRYLTRLKQFINRRVFKECFGRYRPDLEFALLKSYAEQVSAQIKELCPDVIFCPGTIPIAYLQTNLPIFVWTDATFESLRGFYPAFSGLHPCSVRAGNLYESNALKHAALAFYSSEWAAESAVHHYGIARRKVRVVPFGANMDSDLESDVDGVARKRREDVCLLLFLGVDWHRKGGPLAVQVAKELNARGLATELHVVGCSPEKPQDYPPFVKFLGFFSKRDPEGMMALRAMLLRSHFLMLPTEADCTPIVFAEANAFGLPVITRQVGGVCSMITNGVNGYALPGTARAGDYTALIWDVFTDRARYLALAKSSYDEYRQRLNWKVATLEVLLQIRRHLSVSETEG